MKNVIGNNITLTIFGESHGSKIGVTLDGLCAGVKIDYDFIKTCLNKRRPNGINETLRVENDSFEIISGVFNGYSTGGSITILIENNNVKSVDYEGNKDLARPSHADYVAYQKHHGFNDYRGGGAFSGRLTAPIVAIGSILIKCLEKFNIKIGCHIKQIGDAFDKDFSDFEKEIDLLDTLNFPVIDDVSEKMSNNIKKAKDNNDSIGGIIQTAIINLPVGIGEPMFSSLESELSSAMFSIGGIKGIEFGLGFNFKDKLGSQVNDEFINIDGKIMTKTNNNGGINGGISNGMPVVFNVVVKPTPSIGIKQDTINLLTKENQSITITGRHDPAIIRRMCIVIKAMCALKIADLLVYKYGTDVFLKDKLD